MLTFTIKNILNETEEQYLKSRFLKTCEILKIKEQTAASLYDQVHFEYTDWSRHYHNLSHIFSLLKLSEEFENQLVRPHLVDLAIWFHDIVYKSSRKDNEKQSALLFEQLMQAYLSKEDLTYVDALIMSTAGHQPLLPDDPDNLMFLDFDLAILASDKNTYRKYADAIRDEYKSLFSFFVYNSGRKKVMKAFLDRKTLYFSTVFKEQYEPTARQNIEWEIKGLKEG